MHISIPSYGVLRLPASPVTPTKSFAEYLPGRRPIHALRLFVFALAGFTCYLVLSRTTTTQKWVPQVVQDHISNPFLYGAPKEEGPLEDETISGEKMLGHSGNHAFVAHHVGTGDIYQFKEALKDVIAMTPDEIYMRDLLRPLQGGGEERLKEVGVRARTYAKFLNLWEALHVVADEHITYIRDDVVQYLENVSDRDLVQISSMPRGDIIRAYEEYRFFLAQLAGSLFPWTAPYFSDHMTLHAHFHHGGRGIVLSGNDKQAPYFLTSIESFRRLGCDLPVEIMYLGENDLGDDWRMKLEALGGVTTRDLSKMVNDKGWELKGWAAKPFALLLSSFREVIYLDADALLFVNPEELFEDPAYQETGALFFRDRILNVGYSRKNWLKGILPKPISPKAQESRYWTGASSEQQESGALVIDKWKHLVALLTITRMNGPDRDDDMETGAKGVYSMFYGDKETFWLGFELAGDTQYSFHEGPCGIMGTVSEVAQYTYPPDELDSKQMQEEKKKLELENTKHMLVTGESLELGNTTESQDNRSRSLYTISGAQLLHLGRNGRPLWFNGWILEDKWDDGDKPSKVIHMEYFMSEIKETDEDPEWQIQAHNMANLKSNKALPFSPEEKATLDMIVQIASENGALKSGALKSGALP